MTSDVLLPQQLLRTPGGRVTETLEKFLGVTVRAVKLAEDSRVLVEALPELDAPVGMLMSERRVLLCAGPENAPLLYATSMIVPGRLPHGAARELTETDAPIGKVLGRHGLVTTFQARRRWAEPAEGWSALPPALDAGDTVLCRSYRLLVGGLPAMLISERFPARPQPPTRQPAPEDPGGVAEALPCAAALSHSGPPSALLVERLI
jgi:chorismate-pyruvate lyase